MYVAAKKLDRGGISALEGWMKGRCSELFS